MSQRPNYSLILWDTWSRSSFASLIPSRCTGDRERSDSIKSPCPPSRCLRQKENYFSTNWMHWKYFKGCIKKIDILAFCAISKSAFWRVLAFPLCLVNLFSKSLILWKKVKKISSTGQRSVELMRYPSVRRPAVCLSVPLSVKNMLLPHLLCI